MFATLEAGDSAVVVNADAAPDPVALTVPQ